MSKIIDFEQYQEAEIKIERTKEFTVTADKLSDFIRALPLDRTQNDELIRLMIEQINIAEKGAFHQGLSMAFEFMRLEENKG